MQILILDSTTKSIVVALGEAISTSQPEITASYGDSTSTSMTEANAVMATNGVTDVTLVSAPATSTRRIIRNITLYNKDSIAHTFIVRLLDSASYYGITKQYVLPGETWTFGYRASKPNVPVTEDLLSLSDITTANASASRHGFLPKLSGLTYQTLNGAGAWVDMDSWTPSTATWSLSSNDYPTSIFSINADLTTKLSRGMRIKFRQSKATSYYWSFDSVVDSNIGSVTGTAIGSPTFTAGKFSNALTLNGSSAVSHASNILTGNFSINCWIKTSTTAAQQTIYSAFGVSTNYYGIVFKVDTTNTLQFIASDGLSTSTYIVNGAATVTDNAWHQVSVSFRNNYVFLYVDGKLDGFGYIPVPNLTVVYPRIGCQCNNGSTNINFFTGQIDDLTIIGNDTLGENLLYERYVAGTAWPSSYQQDKFAIVTDVGAWNGSAMLLTTMMQVDMTLAGATVITPYYSTQKAPVGFPLNPDKWSVQYISVANIAQASPAANTFYNLGSLSLTVPIGLWNVGFSAAVRIDGTTTATRIAALAVGLSTTTTSYTDNLLKASDVYTMPTGAGTVGVMVTKERVLQRNVKATYYFMHYFTLPTDAMTSLSIRGDLATTHLYARCAYL